MKRFLTCALPALTLCVPALAQTGDSNSGAPAYVGNPDTVYCRMPRAMPGTRLEPVCRMNAEWAHYPGYGMSEKEVEETPNLNGFYFNGHFVDQPVAHPLVGPAQP